MPGGVRMARGKVPPAGLASSEGDKHVTCPAVPPDRHPASRQPRPDLPPHRRLQAREPQRGADRALPPGPSRSARPPFPVAGRRNPQRCPQMPPTSLPTPDELAAELDHARGVCLADGHGTWPVQNDGTHKEPPFGTPAVLDSQCREGVPKHHAALTRSPDRPVPPTTP